MIYVNALKKITSLEKSIFITTLRDLKN